MSKGSLENIKTLLDGKLRELGAAISMLEADNSIRAVAKSESPFSEADTMVAFRKSLDLFTRTINYNSYISNVYLYSFQSGIILSNKYGLSENDNSNFPSEETFGITLDEFYKLLKDKPSYKYVILPPSQGTDSEHILFLYPVSQRIDSNDGIIVVEINTEKLLDLINGTDVMSNAGLVIVDSNGQQLHVIRKNYNIKLPLYNELTGKSNNYQQKIDDYMVYSTESDISKWKYVLIYNEDKYLSNIYKVRNMTILLLAVFLLIGIIASYFFAKRNYSPLQRIMGNINGKLNNTSSLGTNELQCIENSFNILFEEKESFSQRLSRQKSAVLNSLLIQLLKGRISSLEEIKDVMSTENVSFKTDKFIVVNISIEDYGKLFKDDSEDPDVNEAVGLAYIVVQNILENMLGDGYQVYVVEIDTVLACIISVYEKDEKVQKYVEENIEKAIYFIKDKFNMHIFCSISKIHSSLLGIRKCYVEAQIALDRTLLFDRGRIVTKFAELNYETGNKQLGYLRIELRYKLLNNFMAGNFEKAEQLVKEIIQFDKKHKAFPKKNELQRYSLLDDLYCVLDMLSEDSSKELWQEAYNVILELANCRNFEQYTSLIQKLFSLFHKMNREKDEILKSNEKINQILQYIDNNLTDPNLSVTMVADSVGISVSYLTRMMRSKMGMGALEYIQDRRIAAVKKLLVETNLSVNEISMRVGYYNFRSMNYVFKRTEGITATQYREQLRKVGSNAEALNHS
ncbi:AraC family transcriptional regulator [Clostridium sp. SYSU_GA19001]|uniref:helix-turn-helix domain-containing protein n=1 Tax=Clostridium caldaquaticum TaxID=2940653 RepID=UPI0020779435|nr:AraC family transcriptional regulator [Clostridium caldaquaticum]